MFWDKDHSQKPENDESDNKAGIITLYRGITAAQKDFWAILEVQPDKYVELKKTQHSNESINLFDYGEVLDRGYGDHPPAEIFEEIRKKYAIRHNSETFIVDKES